MAEQLSKQTYQILQLFPHSILKTSKMAYRNHRFIKALKQGKQSFHKYGHLYPNKIIFIAGLPKSGTTWIENMLNSFQGYTIIPDPEITLWDYKYRGSHKFQMSMHYFDSIKDTLALVKVHCNGSENNVYILKQLNVPYVIVYRDLRDAAVSHFFYVKRTKWHPEFPIYKNMDITSGLKFFADTLLVEWKDWIVGWQENRDKKNSILVRYEDLLSNTNEIFEKILNLYELPSSNMKQIIDNNKLSTMKKKSNFYRKGKAGDWKNYFNDDLKELFKHKIGDFLIQQNYEQNYDW